MLAKLAYNILRVASIVSLVAFIAAQFYVGISDQKAIRRAGDNKKRSLTPADESKAQAGDERYPRSRRAYPPSIVPVDADSAVTSGLEGRDEPEQVGLSLEGRAQAPELAEAWHEATESWDNKGHEGIAARSGSTPAPFAAGDSGRLTKRQRSSAVVVIPMNRDDGYYPGSTIAKGRRGSSAFSLMSRCVWILFAILLVISEIELPEFLDVVFPVLGGEMGTGWLGFFQFIAALSLLAHRLTLFPYVAALMLFGVGILNLCVGVLGKDVKYDRGFLSGRLPPEELAPQEHPVYEDDRADRASFESDLGLNSLWTKMMHPRDCTDETLQALAEDWVRQAYGVNANPWNEGGRYDINSLKNERLKQFIAHLTVQMDPENQQQTGHYNDYQDVDGR